MSHNQNANSHLSPTNSLSLSGLSPLINSTTVGGDFGVDDKRFYPLSRTYSLGLSVNF